MNITTATETTINVTTNPDSLFGSQDVEAEGYDYQASVERFAGLLWDAIHADYPDATVTVDMQNVYDNEILVYLSPEALMPNWDDPAYDAAVAAVDAQHDAGRSIEEDVLELIGHVHSGRYGDWAVAIGTGE